MNINQLLYLILLLMLIWDSIIFQKFESTFLFIFVLLEHLSWTYGIDIFINSQMRLTIPFSNKRFNMTIPRVFCSQIICQKCSQVFFRGPYIKNNTQVLDSEIFFCNYFYFKRAYEWLTWARIYFFCAFLHSTKLAFM